MKKIIIAAAFILMYGSIDAQAQKQDWYNSSFEKDGQYGSEVDKAYEFLSKKKAKHRPIVAIVGTGVDVEHEALVKNLWVNPKEKADGIDNDGNGLVDDINGWNFIGMKNGETMESLGKEGDREWLRLRGKYEGIMFNGTNYFTYKDGKRVNLPAPADVKEFEYFERLNTESKIAGKSRNIILMDFINDMQINMFKDMRSKNPGRLTEDDFSNHFKSRTIGEDEKYMQYAYQIMGMAVGARKSKAPDSTYDYMTPLEQVLLSRSQIATAKKSFEEELAKYPTGIREKMVGDNPNEINDKKYGNNTLITPNANIGTLVASIIAGERGVEGRNSPICPDARIMPLVVIDKSGEPYIKDMALAIRYAVDNGADVICYTISNTLVPPAHKKWLNDAVAYAEEKGVLIIVNTYANCANLDTRITYPSRVMRDGKEFSNIMTVSPSDKKGKPTLDSNYGTSMVDLYAPGVEVMAGVMGDNYKVASAPAVAMAVTAGVAALIKAYYPQLKPSQIRTILNETVTSRAGAEVEKAVALNGKRVEDMYLFDQLCLSKGIINAYKAVQVADKIK